MSRHVGCIPCTKQRQIRQRMMKFLRIYLNDGTTVRKTHPTWLEERGRSELMMGRHDVSMTGY